jgi:hypothetical protein
MRGLLAIATWVVVVLTGHGYDFDRVYVIDGDTVHHSNNNSAPCPNGDRLERLLPEAKKGFASIRGSSRRKTGAVVACCLADKVCSGR